MLYTIFANVKNYHNTEIAFDQSKTSANDSDFKRKDWSCSYFIITIKNKRELHPRTPTPRDMDQHCWKS